MQAAARVEAACTLETGMDQGLWAMPADGHPLDRASWGSRQGGEQVANSLRETWWPAKDAGSGCGHTQGSGLVSAPGRLASAHANSCLQSCRAAWLTCRGQADCSHSLAGAAGSQRDGHGRLQGCRGECCDCGQGGCQLAPSSPAKLCLQTRRCVSWGGQLME